MTFNKMNLDPAILEKFDVDISSDEDFITIEFGNVKNELIKSILCQIESSLIKNFKTGTASIISTEGKHETLLTVLYFKIDKPLKIEYL